MSSAGTNELSNLVVIVVCVDNSQAMLCCVSVQSSLISLQNFENMHENHSFMGQINGQTEDSMMFEVSSQYNIQFIIHTIE